MKRDILASFLLLALPVSALAQGNMNMQGMSGLLNVPDASVLEYGTALVAWDNQIDGRFSRNRKLNDQGNDINLGAGIFPHIEIVGRNVTGRTTTSGSDLSFDVKVQLPWELLHGVSFALGEQDFGGSVNEYDTKYAVTTWQYGKFRSTLGYGQYDGRAGQTLRLDGVFGGVEYAATDWLSVLFEDDGHSQNTGVRLSTPDYLLPEGWKASMLWMLSGEEGVDGRNDWYGFNVKIPLGQKYERALPSQRARIAVAPRHVEILEEQYGLDPELEKNPLLYPPNSNIQDPNIRARIENEAQLKREFNASNLEKVRVQRYGREWIIAFENLSYNNNVIDGLAVAIGVAASILPEGDRFYLQLEKYGIPVFGLGGEVGAWDAFMNGRGGLPESVMIAAPTNKLRRRSGDGGFVKSTFNDVKDYLAFRPTVMIKPILSSTLGTEFGVFDYSLAARADVVVPLWQGAAFNISKDWSVQETDDFTKDGIFGGVFRGQRIPDGVKDRVISQTVRLGRGFTTMLSYGRFFNVNDGVSLESRWEPGDGRNRFRVILTDFEDKYDPRITRNARLASWRYFFQSTNSEVNITAGEFYSEDSGYKIDFTQHIGDTRLHLIYKKSEGNNFAGIGFTIPLTPRKDVGRFAGVQLTGTPSWRYDINTILGEQGNRLVFGPNVIPTEFFNLRNGYFNGDRLSPAYIRANQERLREAWQTFGVAEK
ncbi:YjbH domain-containing protein [Zhongshania sp. BJYM1]|uniref:YjbH domain-containing protein n=1 Tax=Zhongshania aquatica TaxID=2965069 RepID=UPI0022B40905|nr:YjbH domain-containing protein [Marortus sp. BJYM1]